MNPSCIRPIKNRVVILPEEIEEVSQGGIVLASASVEREAMAQVYGRIVAIGPECQGHGPLLRRLWRWLYTGEAFYPEYCIGDRIIFGRYSGLLEPGGDGAKYRIVNDRDIVAIKTAAQPKREP